MERSDVSDNVKMDHCHANLINALIQSSKPKNILELGFGGGRSCQAIHEAINKNRNNAKYTLVDNWLDFNFVKPSYITVPNITANEKDFVAGCTEIYDFIVSDADHQHTNEWFDKVFNDLLSDSGILIYHDISHAYPNLISILTKCQENNYSHYLFNENSIPGERCERGLLVIFKNGNHPKMARV